MIWVSYRYESLNPSWVVFCGSGGCWWCDSLWDVASLWLLSVKQTVEQLSMFLRFCSVASPILSPYPIVAPSRQDDAWRHSSHIITNCFHEPGSWLHSNGLLTVPISQFNQVTFKCGFMEDWCHGWPPDKSARTRWCYQVKAPCDGEIPFDKFGKF